jgi:hypothetical protein
VAISRSREPVISDTHERDLVRTRVKTFDLLDADGRLHAFEVENFPLGRRGLVRVVKTVPGATIIRKPSRLFSWFREEEFCEFAVGNRRFVADEPFGDNSRYIDCVMDKCRLRRWLAEPT